MKSKRKTQIIELAIQFIQNKGFLQFSYNDLSKELHVTNASIHYHFEKKSDLGIAVCDFLEHHLLKLQNEINELQLPARDKIMMFMKERSTFIVGICPLSSLQTDYQYLPTPMQEHLKNLNDLEIDFIANLFVEQQGSQDRKSNDFHGLATFLLSAVKGGLQYGQVFGSSVLDDILSQVQIHLSLVQANEGESR